MLLHQLSLCTDMSSTSSGTSPAIPAKRACDSCHRRKVKCIPVGENAKPCKNCVSAGLECTFNNKVQKKGPKGSRAKVISEIRETQKHISPKPAVSQSQSRRSSSPSPFARTPGLLTREFLDHCLTYYYSSLYAVFPVLHPRQAEAIVTRMDENVEDYSLLAALCAFVLLKPYSTLPASVQDQSFSSKRNAAKLFLEEAIRVRKGHEWSEQPSLSTVFLSFYVSICQTVLDQPDAAWIYLRQAMTVAHVLGLHDEQTYHYKDSDPLEQLTRRRLFYALFVCERFYALKSRRPLTLSASIQPPGIAEDPDEMHIISAFQYLINLYKPFDNTYFDMWSQSGRRVTPEYVGQLQQMLSDAIPSFSDCTDVQCVDLKISQPWLQAMVWKLASNHGAVSPLNGGGVLSFQFLLDTCQELADRCESSSPYLLEAHAPYMGVKLFDTISILIDATVEFNRHYDARECISRLVNTITNLESSDPSLLSLLHTKIGTAFAGNFQLPFTTSYSSEASSLHGSFSSAVPFEYLHGLHSPDPQQFSSTVFAGLQDQTTSSGYPTYPAQDLGLLVASPTSVDHHPYVPHLPSHGFPPG